MRMFKLVSYFLLFACTNALQAQNASIDDAWKYFSNNKFKEAEKIFKNLKDSKDQTTKEKALYGLYYLSYISEYSATEKHLIGMPYYLQVVMRIYGVLLPLRYLVT